jgi:IS30 family transposase
MMVEEKLELRWSPEQISGWLVREVPGDSEMRVSHETIYQSLFVQTRGALRKELTRYLRTQRSTRRPAAFPKHFRNGQGRIRNLAHISQRPAEAEDRAVPGHWEGDLPYGRGIGTVATLVERHSRFVMLVGLPASHTADVVADALAAKISELPAQLRRSLTWDQGKEMAQHSRFTVASGVPVFFCDPRRPLAARHQREHQRSAPPIPPTQGPTRGSHPARARRDRGRTQRTTTQDLALADTRPSPRRRVALTD